MVGNLNGLRAIKVYVKKCFILPPVANGASIEKKLLFLQV
jgi:hypothetical protein